MVAAATQLILIHLVEIVSDLATKRQLGRPDREARTNIAGVTVCASIRMTRRKNTGGAIVHSRSTAARFISGVTLT